MLKMFKDLNPDKKEMKEMAMCFVLFMSCVATMITFLCIAVPAALGV